MHGITWELFLEFLEKNKSRMDFVPSNRGVLTLSSTIKNLSRNSDGFRTFFKELKFSVQTVNGFFF